MTPEPVVVAPRPGGSAPGQGRQQPQPGQVTRRKLSPTATVVGLLALVFSATYFLSDVIEVIQGGFSVGHLWLTFTAEAAIPIFVVGLAIMYRARLGRLGQVSVWSYAYAYVVFTGTVVYALVKDIEDYQALSDRLGAIMIIHGVVMGFAGLGLGYAVFRTRLLPAWTGLTLMVGVVLVAVAQGLPDGAQLCAAGVRDFAFAGMGAALLRTQIAPTAARTGRHSPCVRLALGWTGSP
jgi:uncharacterized membrane protein